MFVEILNSSSPGLASLQRRTLGKEDGIKGVQIGPAQAPEQVAKGCKLVLTTGEH